MCSALPLLTNSGLTRVQLQCQPYQVKLRRAWRSAQGSQSVRCGYLLRLETGEGIRGYGECAPLPEAGTETPAEAASALQAIVSDCGGGPVAAVIARLEALSGTPAVRCALETALLDIGARQQGMPLSRWLVRDAAERVAVNAACGCLDEGFAARLAEAMVKGYRVIKIKMGLFPLDEELQRLQRLQLPDGVNLRLDANQAWSFDQALQAIEACSPIPVESLEEPLQVPDLALLRVLQQQAPFPLALDESLTDRFVDTPVEELPVQRLVMKPTTMGGMCRVIKRARQAKRAGIDTVVTSTLETSVGLWAVVHVAAALDNQLAHGIGTMEWLENPDPALCPRRGVLDIDPLAAGLPLP